MCNDALVAATAAVVRIAVRVSLAAVVYVIVAITKWSLAVGEGANSRATDGRSVRLIWAYVLARVAIVDARVYVDFTTIAHVCVTIGETSCAGDAALAGSATCASVGGVASVAASAAMGC